jgi:hypothetical protein
MVDQANSQSISFRVVIVCRDTRRILAESSHGALYLPRVSIRRYARLAEQMQAEIESRWKTKVIILDIFAPRPEGDQVALVEAREAVKDCGTTFAVGLSDLDENELSRDELADVQRLLSEGVTGRGPFSKLGWIEEAADWVTAEAAVDRSEMLRPIRQYNAGASFSLVRFGRRPSVYWMKAVGFPNHLERQITLTLAELFPKYLPTIVASRADWNAWLMKDAGEPLSEVRSQEISERVMVRVAELQHASAARIDRLLSSGCGDQRLSVLRAGIPAVVAYLEEAMAGQVSRKVAPLSAARLRELGHVLEDACTSLDELGIPVTLIHNDINPGNILIQDHHVVLNDWAEACVGNPFMTFEHLRLQAAKNSDIEPWIPSLTEAYKQSWRSSMDEATMQSAFRLLPLVAPLSYLYGRGDWLTSSRRYDPVFQVYARSLARYIDRAALVLAREGVTMRVPEMVGSTSHSFQGHSLRASSDDQPVAPTGGRHESFLV